MRALTKFDREQADLTQLAYNFLMNRAYGSTFELLGGTGQGSLKGP